MKIKTISRSEEAFTKECRDDLRKLHRNLDPKLHPFEKAREYTRALQSAKLEKIFAKPFVGALEGHADTVFSMSPSRHSLVQFVTGACDGEVRLWDLAQRKCVLSIASAHTGFVRGMAVSHDGASFFSCGDDKVVKQWRMGAAASDGGVVEPLATYTSAYALTSLDHHWAQPMFATSSETVEVWDHSRSEPVHSFDWGVDSVNSVRFNPAEPCLLASSGSDRNICLYDVRGVQAIRKVILKMRTNALAWNPMEPFNFTAANEDGCLYTFDMRKLERPLMVHKDHVSAVISVAYSPTGREFVSGSYDRTIRIFRVQEGRSREVYHTKRMQRVTAVSFSADAKFVLCGSDDTNVRIWKANASRSLGRLHAREERKRQYQRKLVQRFEHLPEVRRISKHHHVPKAIKRAAEREREARDNERRKDDNRRKHSKPGSVPFKAERDRPMVKIVE